MYKIQYLYLDDKLVTWKLLLCNQYPLPPRSQVESKHFIRGQRDAIHNNHDNENKKFFPLEEKPLNSLGEIIGRPSLSLKLQQHRVLRGIGRSQRKGTFYIYREKGILM